jgi:hypothetical protein
MLFLATLLKPYIKIWQISLNFGRLLAIEISKEHLILALKILNFSCWATYSQ